MLPGAKQRDAKRKAKGARRVARHLGRAALLQQKHCAGNAEVKTKRPERKKQMERMGTHNDGGLAEAEAAGVLVGGG